MFFCWANFYGQTDKILIIFKARDCGSIPYKDAII